METIKLNIALRFDDRTIDEIVESVQELTNTFETKFVVNHDQFIPHLTLYQNLFPKNKIDDIGQLLSDIAGNTVKFNLRFKRLRNYKSSVWAEFDKAPELLNLHQNIIEQIQPLRDGLVEPQFEETHLVYQRLTVTPKKMIEKYGHPYVGEMFEPHTSLVKLVDRELVFAALNRIDWRIRDVDINKLAIYESGEEGTASKIIQEFELAS